jgi:hypothetical protein
MPENPRSLQEGTRSTGTWFEARLARLLRAVRRGRLSVASVRAGIERVASWLEAEGHDVIRPEWTLQERLDALVQEAPSGSRHAFEDTAPWVEELLTRLLLGDGEGDAEERSLPRSWLPAPCGPETPQDPGSPPEGLLRGQLDIVRRALRRGLPGARLMRELIDEKARMLEPELPDAPERAGALWRDLEASLLLPMARYELPNEGLGTEDLSRRLHRAVEALLRGQMPAGPSHAEMGARFKALYEEESAPPGATPPPGGSGDATFAVRTATVRSPSRDPFAVHMDFYVDSAEGLDAHAGTHYAPFQSLLKVRVWFALIELLDAEKWDFSQYRVSVHLRRGREWTQEEEKRTMRMLWLLSSTSPGFPSPPRAIPGPCPWDGLGLPESTISRAIDLACAYLMSDFWLDPEVLALHPDLAGFRGSFLLKFPRGLRNVCLDAYDAGRRPRLSGGYEYPSEDEESTAFPADSGRYWDSNNSGAGIGMVIGEMVWTRDRVSRDEQGFCLFFHENRGVLVRGIRIQGFKRGISFVGPCQDVEVDACQLQTLLSNGIHISLIPEWEYVEWEDPGLGSTSWAFFPLSFDECPNDFDIHDSVFYLIGQETDAAAISLPVCNSYVEIHGNLFVACVDGVMSDGGGSGFDVHHNAFLMAMETWVDEGGDGNAIDFKGVRPRTVEDESEFGRPVPPARYARIHSNFMAGCSGASAVLQMGTGWVHFYENHVIDNYIGLIIGGGSLSMLPRSDFSDAPGATCTDIHGIVSPTWSSPLDAEETGTTFDGSVRTVFKHKHIYVYRNVIAANWSHGISVKEGPTIMNNEAVDPVTGLRTAYALSIEDLVIAQNTVDSNGGVWKVDSARRGDCDGMGICLVRRGALPRWACADSSAWTLGDHFLGVAIYNNLLSNNWYFQLYLADSTLYAHILTAPEEPMPASETHNVETRPPVAGVPFEGIQDFHYYGLDYNACFYALAPDWSVEDIKVATFSTIDYLDPAATETRTVVWESRSWMDEEKLRAIGFEINGVVARFASAWSYEALYSCGQPAGAHVEAVGTFGFASAIRGTHGGFSLSDFYLELLAGDALNAWWRTNLAATSVQGRGAADPADFPDATLHVETLDPISSAPDIEGRTATGAPDLGAYQRS